MLKSPIILLSILLFFSACSKKPVTTKKPVSTDTNTVTNTGRYAIEQDLAPDFPDFDTSTLTPWDIQVEAKSRYGNHSPYIVFGKTYYLADTADTDKNFEQTGTASWYGKKFHGHSTSNMEIFDMYKFTAAHRTLPLPSYVEVTNLENNKKVVVRVNDRGPFKSQRIIDLSWAAAKALDYDGKGLAKVHIKLIQAPTHSPSNNLEVNNSGADAGMKFLQVGAFSQRDYAMNIATELSQITLLPVHVTDSNTHTPLYRVRIGPLTEDLNIIDIIDKVHKNGFNHTKMVVE